MVQEKSVEQWLGDGGFTPFHKRIVLITGFAWTFVAMEIILISLVVGPILTEFRAPQENYEVYSFLLSSTLVGSFIGSLVIGPLADRKGRRLAFQLSILWYSIFTALSAASWNWESLFLLRLIAGLGLGGMLVVDPSILSEYLPPQSRGRFLVFLDFFWPLGFLLAIGLTYYFMVVLTNSWRLLFVVAAFPAFMAFVFRLTIPESPYFLARSGRMKEAAEVLAMATGRQVDVSSILPESERKRVPILDLLRMKLIRASIVTIIVWIALNFSYYGLFLWLPYVLGEVTQQVLSAFYPFLVLSAFAQFPGYLTSMYLVEKWGRRGTLALFLILGGISGYAFAVARDFVTLVSSLFFVSFFNLGAWGAVYPYTAELFPTQLRSSAFGMAEGVGKITAILAPIVFARLLGVSESIVLPLTVIAVLMLVGGFCAAALGRETKGEHFV